MRDFRRSKFAILMAVGLFVGLNAERGNAQSYATEWIDGKAIRLEGVPSMALGINDAGVVVGYSSLGPTGTQSATEWNGGSTIDLGIGYADAINNLGQVVGSTVVNGDLTAVEWSGGSVINLGRLPDSLYAYAASINNLGQVVGFSESDTYVYSAVEWSGGQIIKLAGLPGSTQTAAMAINDAGQIVGYSVVGGVYYATEWSGGSIINLGVLLGTESTEALGINNAGDAVGDAFSLDGASSYAAEWSGGLATDLGSPPDAAHSVAYGINDEGLIVGDSEFGSTDRAVEWEDGSPIILGQDGLISVAQAINDNGVVVGGETPEPSTWAMMLVGFAGLGFAGYRSTRRQAAAAFRA
jgi:probable HAF family extracellular repeat protein